MCLTLVLCQAVKECMPERVAMYILENQDLPLEKVAILADKLLLTHRPRSQGG